MQDTIQISKEIIFFLGVVATVIGFIWRTSQKETVKEIKINEIEKQLSIKTDTMKKDIDNQLESIKKDISFIDDKIVKGLKNIEDKINSDLIHLKKSNKMRKDEIKNLETELEHKISQMKQEILNGIEKQNEIAEKKHNTIYDAIKGLNEQVTDSLIAIRLIEAKVNKNIVEKEV